VKTIEPPHYAPTIFYVEFCFVSEESVLALSSSEAVADDSNSLLLPPLLLLLSSLLSLFLTCCSCWGLSNSSMSGLFVSDGEE
jgi:hypothetical protein